MRWVSRISRSVIDYCRQVLVFFLSVFPVSGVLNLVPFGGASQQIFFKKSLLSCAAWSKATLISTELAKLKMCNTISALGERGPLSAAVGQLLWWMHMLGSSLDVRIEGYSSSLQPLHLTRGQWRVMVKLGSLAPALKWKSRTWYA